MYKTAQRPDEQSSKKSSEKIKLNLGFDVLIEAIEQGWEGGGRSILKEQRMEDKSMQGLAYLENSRWFFVARVKGKGVKEIQPSRLGRTLKDLREWDFPCL